MVGDPERFERLVRELAELAPEARTRLVAEACRRAKALPKMAGFRPPNLTGGTGWIGGELRREDIYGDDGR